MHLTLQSIYLGVAVAVAMPGHSMIPDGDPQLTVPARKPVDSDVPQASPIKAREAEPQLIVPNLTPFQDGEWSDGPPPSSTLAPYVFPTTPAMAGSQPRGSEVSDQEIARDDSSHASSIEARDARAGGGSILGKRQPQCTSKCLRPPRKTPRERHDCIRHCVRRSLD